MILRDYPWYEVVNSNIDIMQGDFISGCPIVTPPSEIQEGDELFDVVISKYNVIIMSQSCDLKNKKISLVLLCPVWPLENLEVNNYYKSSKGKEELRKGNAPGYHLLNKCELKGYSTGYQVVDFRNIYSVSLDFLIDFTKRKDKRLRLLPPYREHLSKLLQDSL